MGLCDFIDFNDISVKEWDELFAIAVDIKKNPEKYMDSCKGKILATLFYEPSTRTMFSFQTAMLRLGGKVIGFSEPNNSSVSKGEDLHDTIKTVSCYADIIAIRHPLEGAAMAASLYSDVPVINAGDGGHLHPTQTLTDLTTIMIEKGRTNNLNIGICGDLKNGRTVHSLIKALSRSKDITFTLISPKALATPDYILDILRQNGVRFIQTEDLDASITDLDVLYMTRIQRERFSNIEEYERYKGVYILDANRMKKAKNDMLVMHPFPRVDEISHDVDSDPRAMYFKQAKHGLFIRMALILKMLAGPFNAKAEDTLIQTSLKCTNPRCITSSETYLPKIFKHVKNNDLAACCIYCDRQYEIPSEEI